MGDSLDEIAKDVLTVGRLDAVPTLLKVLCETTGMGLAAVARVTKDTWTACAVQDGIQFGLRAGDQVDVDSTLYSEARGSLKPIIIDQMSTDPHYRARAVPGLLEIESYISVPIVMANGCCFGTLCALDPKPARVSAPRIVSMFTRFAELIALQIDNELKREQEHTALLDERAAGELREQFIAVLGHDLRNPLHAVYASGELLERKLTDPLLSGIAARIKVNSRRMSALIDDVLDFARGRLGSGIGVQLEEVEDFESGLTAVVREFQDSHSERIIISNISVTRAVRCDLGRLQQVASNLLGNALTHGSAQTPIEFTAKEDGANLVLEVWNAGEPIPPECVAKIFEPFWRHSTSGSRNGLGLGLYICSQIVRAHKGQLTVTSTREDGTQFTARLPLGTLLTVQTPHAAAAHGTESRQHQSNFSASMTGAP